MKTEISRFCEACLTSLNALPPALAAAAEECEKGRDKTLLARPLAALYELRARLRSLVEKLENQQAYLLIFGPLKSGKSTLMNAISGAYVSEVTSLPGYPCLVYVQHAPEAHFSVTRYNGRETVFANAVVLKDIIADSHLALAQQIRATEARGERFEPLTHFSEAIRRVDVKVPVPTLAESSTVLVDTPGLYSRMNFGYDMLTREFRNSAACAVFVVKTDNLFLEQVFNEFNQLLGLFSRIFLVINVDSSKRDLQPDGSLTPSAESQHPERVIEAFRTLSMAGPLREAYEQRRVRIHAVDLMNAASSFLTKLPEDAPEPGPDRQRVAFDAFIGDLTEYLNSSDYTVEFIGDSLRQGYLLCLEARAVLEGGEMDQLRAIQAQLDAEVREFDARIEAVDRLLMVDWEATFHLVRQAYAQWSAEGATARIVHLGQELSDALDAWLVGHDSLQTLEAGFWNPLLVETALAWSTETRQRLRELLDAPLGGAEPASAVMTDLYTVGFSLALAAQQALPATEAEENLEAYPMSIDATQIPVRKSWADWLLFRKISTVRERLFGANLERPIAAEEKFKRLPPLSRAALLQLVNEAQAHRFPRLPEQFGEALLAAYVDQFRQSVLAALREHREALVEQRIERQIPFDINTDILLALQQLDDQASQVVADLQRLAAEENTPLLTAPPSRPPRPSAMAVAAPTPGIVRTEPVGISFEPPADETAPPPSIV